MVSQIKRWRIAIALLLVGSFLSVVQAALFPEDQQKIQAIKENLQKNWDDVKFLWNRPGRQQAEIRRALRPLLEGMVAHKLTFWQKDRDLLGSDAGQSGASESSSVAFSALRAPEPAAVAPAAPAAARGGASSSSTVQTPLQFLAKGIHVSSKNQLILEDYQRNPLDWENLREMMVVAISHVSPDRITFRALIRPVLYEIFQGHTAHQYEAAEYLWFLEDAQQNPHYAELRDYFLRIARDPHSSQQENALSSLWHTRVHSQSGWSGMQHKRDNQEVAAQIALELIGGAAGPAKQAWAFQFLGKNGASLPVHGRDKYSDRAWKVLVLAAEPPGPMKENALALVRQYEGQMRKPGTADRIEQLRRLREAREGASGSGSYPAPSAGPSGSNSRPSNADADLA